ncbi:PBP1A family penicillin-binding protein [Acidicapsa acidisoli]|uniref:PBP1A family penicillin-binding protein n=1 Tax=Acidicapsa acidisoli TaxID=1615681 RepID=UPI0021E015C5|nr:PBP1A family penicillin-binding protein [Acidicapsa acidisoli]
MALKVRIARPTTRQGWSSLILRAALACVALVALFVFAVGGYYYFRYQGIVDARLKQPLFATTAKIYAAPREVRPGQKLSRAAIVNELRSAGYTGDGTAKDSPLGTFTETANSVTVHPGPQSYHAQDGATIHFDNGVVQSLTDDRGQALSSYELEPLLITGLSEGANRTKRRLITYDEIPQNLVHAVLAIEDRQFFEHNGVNFWRFFVAATRDVRSGRYKEGSSTLTMQLARGFFLSPEKRIKRKLIEIVITFQLEHRFSKKQIFEMYANQINLGQQGSFAINGFGEASQAYFGKDVKELNLAESAMLAGIIQRPNYFNPYRHPERVMERRNLVLDSMVETGAITKEQAERAKDEPLHLSQQSVDASDAPYFVDLVRDQLNQKLGERDFNREGLHIYTSLDPDLQRAATSAVENTVHVVDEQVDKLYARRHRGKNGKPEETTEPHTYPQVALVALNPHTGQVLALVGGRSYGLSQLNHAISARPTGSIFKPFVYAAAFNTAVAGTQLPGHDELFSPITMLSDEQTTYDVGNQEYTPRNFEGEYHEQVTARFALQKSLNNATIGLASLVGFDQVAALARSAGVKSARGTPAMAIGAYDATPLEMAGAYTIFANGGLKLEPWMVASVRTPSGDVITDYSPTSKQILDPRVAYLTTNMLENVINHGTGFPVRARGFTAPAAGKTGTSHDAWFAGYTSNLLCIVWVGNDDYTDIKIQGADAAAPIWAEFMKKAVALPQYSDTHEFNAPEGVQLVQVDKTTNLPADSTCESDTYTAAFLDGTVPAQTCSHPNTDKRNFLQRIFGLGEKKP